MHQTWLTNWLKGWAHLKPNFWPLKNTFIKYEYVDFYIQSKMSHGQKAFNTKIVTCPISHLLLIFNQQYTHRELDSGWLFIGTSQTDSMCKITWRWLSAHRETTNNVWKKKNKNQNKIFLWCDLWKKYCKSEIHNISFSSWYDGFSLWNVLWAFFTKDLLNRLKMNWEMTFWILEFKNPAFETNQAQSLNHTFETRRAKLCFDSIVVILISQLAVLGLDHKLPPYNGLVILSHCPNRSLFWLINIINAYITSRLDTITMWQLTQPVGIPGLSSSTIY